MALTNSEKRDWLLNEILAAGLNLGFLDDDIPLYVTFDCPWNASYKIQNTVEALELFRGKIERCPGFAGQKFRKPGPIGGYGAAGSKLSQKAFDKKYKGDWEVIHSDDKNGDWEVSYAG